MTKQVQISVPEWLFEELQAAAKRDLASISTTGRKAIARGLGVDRAGASNEPHR
jgi:hypothetical protein